MEVCRYVVLNPIRARVVERVQQWRWSSYRATAGFEKKPFWLTVDWVLGQFGQRRSSATRHYRRFVGEGVGRPSLWQQLRGQTLLGEEDFVDRMLGYVRGYEEIKEIPRRQRYLSRPSLEKLFGGKLSRGRRNGLVVQAVRRYGYSQKEVADHLGLHYATVSRLANEELHHTRNKT